MCFVRIFKIPFIFQGKENSFDFYKECQVNNGLPQPKLRYPFETDLCIYADIGLTRTYSLHHHVPGKYHFQLHF